MGKCGQLLRFELLRQRLLLITGCHRKTPRTRVKVDASELDLLFS
jgi:hypothetical protein